MVSIRVTMALSRYSTAAVLLHKLAQPLIEWRQFHRHRIEIKVKRSSDYS
jgi:hypothetical protein